MLQRLQLIDDARYVFKELAGVVDGHVEDVGNILALVFDFQRFPVIAGAVADFTGDVDVRQEVHFDADDAVAFAGFAAAAFDVEAEAAGLVAPDLGFCRLAVELADGVEDARIRRRIGPRRPADRRLVDVDDLVDVFNAFQGLEPARPVRRAVDGFGHTLVEDFIDQRRLARAGHAGDDGQGPDGDGDVYMF